MNSIRVFPFFDFILCWNEISKKSSLKEYTKKMENCKVNHILNRSSHRRSSVRNGMLRNFAKFTGKAPLRVSFLSCFSKTAAKIYFLSEVFGEKSKHTEIVLNYIQKQYFSEKSPLSLHYGQIATQWTSKNLFLKLLFFKCTLRR